MLTKMKRLCLPLVLVSRWALEKTIEQRFEINFCAKLDKILTNTNQMIQEAFWNFVLSYFQVSKGLNLPENGWKEVKDTSCSKWSSACKSNKNVCHIHDLFNIYSRMSVEMIVDTLNISKTSVHVIFYNIWPGYWATTNSSATALCAYRSLWPAQFGKMP